MPLFGIFKLYASGKTFVDTYKAGKKSWESGTGWAKTFLMIGLSILACVNLGQMAAQGKAMMAADQAKAAASAGKAGAKNAAENAAGGKGSNPFDLDGNGRLQRMEMMKMIKDNKVPGIDMSDPRYAGVHGWQNFQSDLRHNPEFLKIVKKSYGSGGSDRFFRGLRLAMQGDVAQNTGVRTFYGNSWWQRFIGADPTEAEEAAKSVARAMGNNV